VWNVHYDVIYVPNKAGSEASMWIKDPAVDIGCATIVMGLLHHLARTKDEVLVKYEAAAQEEP
jgi:hypothetical protein